MPQAPAPPESIEEAIARVTRFREARDWDERNAPQYLSRAVSVEASELEEEFLWKNEKDVAEHLRSEEGPLGGGTRSGERRGWRRADFGSSLLRACRDRPAGGPWNETGEDRGEVPSRNRPGLLSLCQQQSAPAVPLADGWWAVRDGRL